MRKLQGPLRWGFFGAGKITSDFVTILQTFPKSKHVPFGIASRDENKAKKFAEGHQIQKVFKTYQQLAEDPEIDIVYIGTVNSEHYSQAKLAMNHQKHVLIEKPICANFKQCSDLIQTAQKNKVFFMEGLWTMTFPATKKLFSEIKNGSIGEIVLVRLEIGGGGKFGEFDRFKYKELCGGALLNHGVYGLMITYLLLGYPDLINANGFLTEAGVDETFIVSMLFKDKRRCISNVSVTSRAKVVAELCIVGTKGVAKLPVPFWAPDKCELPSGTLDFPLPKCEGIKNDHPFNYPYATGFVYEIEEVYRCISEGLQESPFVPWKASLATMQMADEVRKQLGVVFAQDEDMIS